MGQQVSAQQAAEAVAIDAFTGALDYPGCTVGRVVRIKDHVGVVGRVAEDGRYFTLLGDPSGWSGDHTEFRTSAEFEGDRPRRASLHTLIGENLATVDRYFPLIAAVAQGEGVPRSAGA